MEDHSKTDAAKAADVILTAALSRAIDFVKFAETKNAALLAFGSAWTLGITTILNTQTQILTQGTVTSMAVARALFVIAILMTTWSFLPKLRTENFERKVRARNLLFFKHVAELKPSAVKDAIATRYVSGGAVTNDYLDDLACQVAINSAIASKKFRIFELAAISVMLGIVVLALPALGSGLHELLTLIAPKL